MYRVRLQYVGQRPSSVGALRRRRGEKLVIRKRPRQIPLDRRLHILVPALRRLSARTVPTARLRHARAFALRLERLSQHFVIPAVRRQHRRHVVQDIALRAVARARRAVSALAFGAIEQRLPQLRPHEPGRVGVTVRAHLQITKFIRLQLPILSTQRRRVLQRATEPFAKLSANLSERARRRFRRARAYRGVVYQ